MQLLIMEQIEQPATVEDRSAVKIQAGIRGYLVRKQQRLAKEAATKIQAGFRGFKARKDMKNAKQTT